MKKVLIVTPNWPPVSCPDLHRVRMALPYFAQFGWEPLILKINPAEQEGIKDPDLCRTVPENTRTWQAECLPLWLTKWTGLRNVGLRSFSHLARAGDRVIQREKPHVVFFSTTIFALMMLGRYWRWRHGIPYVLDFQDPWRRAKKLEVRSQKSECEGGRPMTSDLRPPNIKRRLADSFAAMLEPFVLRRVSHIVSVSPAYPAMLRARYSWLSESDFTVLPFGAAETDYELLRATPVPQFVFSPTDGRQHWVYVGVCIPQMSLALRAFFIALNEALKKQPALRKELQIHFIGTNYAPKEWASKMVEPLVLEYGLGDVVNESTDRIPYFEALQCLLDADALFIPGSTDPGYTASKLYPYILAKKPLLAVFHEASSVVEVLSKTKAGTVVSFTSGEHVETLADRLLATGWFAPLISDLRPLTSNCCRVPATDWSEFEPYTARAMTRKLCDVFASIATGRRMTEAASNLEIQAND